MKLRFIECDGHRRIVQAGTDEVFQKIADTLGVLPYRIPKNASAILLVEAESDFPFVHHTAEMLKEGGYLPATFQERRFAVVPIGGCGNIKHWRTLQLAEQFGIPYCVLLDSDLGIAEEPVNRQKIAQLQAEGIKSVPHGESANPENYIDMDCLQLPEGSAFTLSDTDDAKLKISIQMDSNRKTVLEDYWIRMSCEQIRQAEAYLDNGIERFEFTEMFADFLSLGHGNT